MTYISWSIDFAFYHSHQNTLFLYIKKWHRLGVFVPLLFHDQFPRKYEPRHDKTSFYHMRTKNAQISLRIHAV